MGFARVRLLLKPLSSKEPGECEAHTKNCFSDTGKILIARPGTSNGTMRASVYPFMAYGDGRPSVLPHPIDGRLDKRIYDFRLAMGHSDARFSTRN